MARLRYNERQILVSLDYSLYYSEEDLTLPHSEAEEIAMEDMHIYNNNNNLINNNNNNNQLILKHTARRRGNITDIFPLEGLLSLTYSRSTTNNTSSSLSHHLIQQCISSNNNTSVVNNKDNCLLNSRPLLQFLMGRLSIEAEQCIINEQIKEYLK